MHQTSGKIAEAKVAEHLEARGFMILHKNWRTRSVEIDIIARINTYLYFVEVKYRRSSEWGYGIDYINKRKAAQLLRGVNEYIYSSMNNNLQPRVLIASVAGEDYSIELITLW